MVSQNVEDAYQFVKSCDVCVVKHGLSQNVMLSLLGLGKCGISSS